jgi:hypothetical protein
MWWRSYATPSGFGPCARLDVCCALLLTAAQGAAMQINVLTSQEALQLVARNNVQMHVQMQQNPAVCFYVYFSRNAQEL